MMINPFILNIVSMLLAYYVGKNNGRVMEFKAIHDKIQRVEICPESGDYVLADEDGECCCGGSFITKWHDEN